MFYFYFMCEAPKLLSLEIYFLFASKYWGSGLKIDLVVVVFLVIKLLFIKDLSNN